MSSYSQQTNKMKSTPSLDLPHPHLTHSLTWIILSQQFWQDILLARGLHGWKKILHINQQYAPINITEAGHSIA
jgi:hypothetical protein